MTSQSSFTGITEHQDRPTCCHHWIIQPAEGPLSLGVCRVCGENREFRNYLGDSSWYESNLVSRPGLGSSKTMPGELDYQEQREAHEEG